MSRNTKNISNSAEKRKHTFIMVLHKKLRCYKSSIKNLGKKSRNLVKLNTTSEH